MPSLSTNNHLVIGRFGKTFGLKGWLRVNSETKPKSNMLTYQPWLLKTAEGFKAIKIIENTLQGEEILVHVEGVDTPEAAKALTNHYVYLERKQLPTLASNEYYWADLEGLVVVTTENITLGTVKYLMEAGSCAVMVIKGNTEHLVPFDFSHIVKQVDLTNGKIIVDWDPNF